MSGTQLGYGVNDAVGDAMAYVVPVTGFAITMTSRQLLLNPAGTLATGAVTLPLNPPDGCIAEITTTQQLTSFTVSANTGDSLAYGVLVAVTEIIPTNSATAGIATGTIKYKYTLAGYQATSNSTPVNPRTWIRVQ
jgi:hypothetical protein